MDDMLLLYKAELVDNKYFDRLSTGNLCLKRVFIFLKLLH